MFFLPARFLNNALWAVEDMLHDAEAAFEAMGDEKPETKGAGT